MFLFFVRVRHVYWRAKGNRDSGKERKKERKKERYGIGEKERKRKERKKEPMNRGRRRSVVGWLRNNLVRRFVASLTG